MALELKEMHSLALIRQEALAGVRSHYRDQGLMEIAVPVLVGITGACENVSTLFNIADAPRLHLTQTGQLAMENALQMTSGLYCVTPSFRTDHVDARHLNEFTLVEEEVCCDHESIGMARDDYDPAVMFDHLLAHIEGAVKSIIRHVLATVPDAVELLGGDLASLDRAVSTPMPRISYTEGVELLNRHGEVEIAWGDDLTAVHEEAILELMARSEGRKQLPTFITHFPKDVKFFNMRVDDADPRVVQSADLILPVAGESVGSAVREEDYDRLVERLTTSTMYRHLVEMGIGTLDDFVPYLDVIARRATAPHAGYGIGLERVMQYLVGGDDIRLTAMQYQLNELLGFDRDLVAAQRGSNSPGF